MVGHRDHPTILALADILQGTGVTADTLDTVTPDEWATACWCVSGMGIPVGIAERNPDATRRLVRTVLENRARNGGDVFAQLP